jgi:hypothetical protein
LTGRHIYKALGELVVIVLGILIALFTEGAWNDYQDRMDGLEYLERLSVEATANLEHLTLDEVWAREACSSAEAALAELQDVNIKPDPAVFLRFAVSASLYNNPEYQRATYDDLVATGGLSLIEDTSTREKIVAANTVFFENLRAWRPPKDGPLRTAVLRALPGEFIQRVGADCLVEPDSVNPAAAFRQCSVTPESGTVEAMFAKLNAWPDLEGYLSERAWQTCEFEDDMASAAESLSELVEMLDAASRLEVDR